MTRSHKRNDRDHQGLADGTADPEQHLPRYFAKHGHPDTDPTKSSKKDGGGKHNWGRSGDEVMDEGFNLTKPRRRSNSSVDYAGREAFKTKFETIEQEPVFDEALHGAGDDKGADLDEGHDGGELDKQSTTNSSVDSIAEEEAPVDAGKV